ncbi:hypothetical protein BAUCODRAFT_142608 [Baudoinia panamericana UAMH 10762]|uniref:Uncharacterized protein n=1 Tax=Baudoinia panamericana (strain UAMH 10762) TaxID=717646 RepID=M2LGC8_BAUPA|nr:uncharacterized protein BAUCODRAFT_142608 [Baudoinia panamericana UAMH 10762]EMC93112.1 hypothetical protein BAUCODRAFT_142608 [Baudoinia panamericana UAMH 10762]
MIASNSLHTAMAQRTIWDAIERLERACEQHDTSLTAIVTIHRPLLSGFCSSYEELETAQVLKDDVRRMHWIVPDTIKETLLTVDKSNSQVARAMIYRYGELSNKYLHQALKYFNGSEYVEHKVKLLAVQGAAMAKVKREATIAVVNFVNRGGGFDAWLASTAEQRRKCWGSAYGTIAPWVDLLFFSEEAKSINFEVIHAVRDNELMDKLRRRNRIVVLRMLEAVWTWIVSQRDGDRCDWQVRQIWRSMGKCREITQLDLPDGIEELPGVPGGVGGINHRRAHRAEHVDEFVGDSDAAAGAAYVPSYLPIPKKRRM